MKLIIQRKRIFPILIILFLWNAGLFLTPILTVSPVPLLKNMGHWLYQLYDPVCHQLPHRSWHIDTIPLPTCIRCTVFYAAGLIIVVIYYIKQSISLFPIKYYILLVLPTAIDFTIELSGLYHNIPLIRSITAILLSFALFHCLIRSVSIK
jgi:uncharacterized membrane protein